MTTSEPGLSAEDIAEMPRYLRVGVLVGHRPCPGCGRYFGNRDFVDHARVCIRKAGEER